MCGNVIRNSIEEYKLFDAAVFVNVLSAQTKERKITSFFSIFIQFVGILDSLTLTMNYN